MHAVDLAGGDELRQSLVELVHDEAVETDRMVQQPMEGVDRQASHDALAQRLDVVAVAFALERGALSEPASRRQAAERHGLALVVVAAHLEQALHHAEPVRHRPPDPAHVVARQGVTDPDVRGRTVVLVGLEYRQPWNARKLVGCGLPAALMQREIAGHGPQIVVPKWSDANSVLSAPRT